MPGAVGRPIDRAGGSGGVPLALEELSLSCCAQVSGPCLERLAPYLATTLTTLRLKVPYTHRPAFYETCHNQY